MEVYGLVEAEEGVLRERWEGLCARVGSIETGDQVALTFEMVRTLYATPARSYHNLGHIAACLVVFDGVRSLAEDADAVEAALWLHHAVYFPEKFDNEEQSAFVGRTVLGLIGAPAWFVGDVERNMLATRHEGEPARGDAALTADIDIAVLGAGADEYERYRRAVYEEFSFADDEMFARGRLAFLERQLERWRIYWTPYFFRELEARARANIERERDALERAWGW
jgi:predicted metal-dependent HD superfamily phosphohydrolase